MVYDPKKFLTEDGIKALSNLRDHLVTHAKGYFIGDPKYEIPFKAKVFGFPNLYIESINELRYRIKCLNQLLGERKEVIIK